MSKGIPHLSSSNVAEYYELHIEQGPLLEAKELAAAIFTPAGIPSGMISVRNAYGSHNADESMDLDDFAEGCRIWVAVLSKRGCQR